MSGSSASRSRHGSGWRGTTSAPRVPSWSAAEACSTAARSERDEAERPLAEVARRREAAEEAFAAQSRLREQLQGRLFAARSAAGEPASGPSGATRRIPPPSAASVAARQLALLEEQPRPDDRPADPGAASPSWRPSSPDWSSSVSAG